LERKEIETIIHLQMATLAVTPQSVLIQAQAVIKEAAEALPLIIISPVMVALVLR
jgi:hypothetical protein